ncbi:PoNi-like cognate immunity protein [Snodgrassella communis]|uniref:PoNi-like cognate immunity protein n=1 Tax=Snodgrassella communis TaxID=2946699 RepID=UPI001EF70684|nr:PoNi-like cognate immunity protein [Snodgrassella communis]
MKLRDKLNTKERYQEIINKKEKYIQEDFLEIKSLEEDEKKGIQKYPRRNNEIIKSKKDNIINYYIDLLKAEYSIGFGKQELSDLYQEYLNFFILTGEAKSSKDFLYGENPTPYYSTDQYDILLFTFSLAILLNINDEDFKKLVKVRDLVQEPDKLLDFIINYKLGGRATSAEMNANEYKSYSKIIDIAMNNKEEGIQSLKQYLSKQWFNDYKKMGWSESHKSKHNIHSGYWSFESGALAKILGLDDSTLKDQPYYPYDMVHWKE